MNITLPGTVALCIVGLLAAVMTATVVLCVNHPSAVKPVIISWIAFALVVFALKLNITIV